LARKISSRFKRIGAVLSRRILASSFSIDSFGAGGEVVWFCSHEAEVLYLCMKLCCAEVDDPIIKL
jgi:hypothetical protein